MVRVFAAFPSLSRRTRGSWQRKEKRAVISLDENFGTRSLRGRPRAREHRPETVNQAPESELSAVANNARRDEGIVEFTPRGVALSRLTSRAQFTHYYGTGTARRRQRRRRREERWGAPINYMGNCARIIYVRIHRHEPRALGHATLLHATPCHAAVLRSGGYR